MAVDGMGPGAAEGQGAAVPMVSDIAAPTVGNDAMEARIDMSGAAPCPLPQQPLARKEETQQSRTEVESEARACNCSLCANIRTPIAFDPAGFGGRLSRSTFGAAAGGASPRLLMDL